MNEDAMRELGLTALMVNKLHYSGWKITGFCGDSNTTWELEAKTIDKGLRELASRIKTAQECIAKATK